MTSKPFETCCPAHDEHRQILRSVPLPWHVDFAYRTEANPDPTTRLLLLTNDDDILRYDRALIRPSEASLAAEPLQAFSVIADGVAVPVHLEPGQLVVLDNFRTSHARTPYTPGSTASTAG